MSIVLNKNVAQSIDQKWNPKADTLFYVVDRHNGGVVAKYKVRFLRRKAETSLVTLTLLSFF